MAMCIVLEGPEGAGKTTIANTTRELIEQTTNLPVLGVREPGGTKVGTAIREILLKGQDFRDMDPTTGMLLFTSARNELYEKVIKPFTIKNPNGVIIGDRTWLSTLAIQPTEGVNQE